MMCATVLHGGVCHYTSTPLKSGNKMKEYNKKKFSNCIKCHCAVFNRPLPQDRPPTGIHSSVL